MSTTSSHKNDRQFFTLFFIAFGTVTFLSSIILIPNPTSSSITVAIETPIGHLVPVSHLDVIIGKVFLVSASILFIASGFCFGIGIWDTEWEWFSIESE